MKTTTALVALVAIVGLTYYFRGSLPPLASDKPLPFQLAEPPASDIPLIQAPLLEEAFRGSVTSSSSSSSPSVVSVSDIAYDAMTAKQKSDLIRGIQQAIRHELLSARQLEHPEYEQEREQEQEERTGSASVHQGRDYKKRCENNNGEGEGEGEEQYRCPKNPDGSCPPIPDMSMYIRKDQIPCWGCSVDY
jgi:hypothetical protein